MEGSNRRDFLKTFSLLTGGSVLLGHVPLVNEMMAQDTKGRTVKLGMIGIGSRGKYLLEVLQMIPGHEITCFCDNYEPHFERAQELIGPHANGYYNYKEMLEKEEIDAVVIATPLFEHARMTIDSLDAGLHVFCEKAMGMNYQECNEMVMAQKRNNRILHIGHQRLYNVKYLKALEDIRNDLLGKVTQIRAYWHRNSDWRRNVPSPELERKINWRLYLDYSRGLMTELASHQIQVANWILEEVPECVWGAGSINYWKDGREVYDNVNLVYKYPGDTHLVYDSMTSNKKYGFEEQILGPKGTMELEMGKKYKEFPPPAPGIIQLINDLEHRFFETVPIGGASWVPENPSEDKGDYIIDKVMESDGSIMQMEAFVSNVKANKVDPWLVKEGFYASIACLMGHEAMMNNSIVYWPDNLAL